MGFAVGFDNLFLSLASQGRLKSAKLFSIVI